MSEVETDPGVLSAVIDTDMEIDDWDDAQEYAKEIIQDWMKFNAVDEQDEVMVHYNGATWQRLRGSAPAVASSLPMIFKVNGDYTLNVQYNVPMNVLLITRSSHDEPMGANHVIEKIRD
jgi:hypothetical protein